jgi:hypothetical protein
MQKKKTKNKKQKECMGKTGMSTDGLVHSVVKQSLVL